jgi:hypothetical protein
MIVVLFSITYDVLILPLIAAEASLLLLGTSDRLKEVAVMILIDHLEFIDFLL